MMKEKTRKTEDVSGRFYQWPAVLVFSLLIFGVSAAAGILTSAPTTFIETPAVLDTFDFSAGIGEMNDDLYDSWPNQLYTPADFAAGSTVEPSFSYSSSNNKARDYFRYETYRLTVNLKPGEYAINFSSPTYAGRVWINGVLVSETGTVSDRKETFVPKTDVETVAFTATDQPTEFVIQRANYVHKQGGIGRIYLGPQDQILQFVEKEEMKQVWEIGFLAIAGLFFFGVFLFFHGQRQFLWFSLACLMIALRSLFTWPKLIMLMLPDLDWGIGHRTELSSMTLAYFFLLMFYDEAFRHTGSRIAKEIAVSACMASVLLVLFLPSLTYSYLTQVLMYVDALALLVYFCFLFRGVIRRWHEFDQMEYMLLIAGIASASILSLADLFRYHISKDINLTLIGMLVLVLLTSMALVIGLKKTQDALDAAAQREADMKKVNQTLSELSRIRTDFMASMSHELRTPLTVMASYAGVTKMQIEQNAVDKQTTENLDVIQKEAVRMGRMVEQMKNVAQNRENKVDAVPTDLCRLLQQAAVFCRPVVEKNRNLITTKLPEEPLIVRVVPDSILQVLYNLIFNSNRHCHDSRIVLEAEKNQDHAEVQIIDHGDGIAADVLPHVFERGFSKDGSSGLGLAVCQEIMEDSGGSIRILSRVKEGTRVILDLPLEAENENKEADSDSGR